MLNHPAEFCASVLYGYDVAEPVLACECVSCW